MTEATIGTVQSVVEAILFVVPLLFFVILLVWGSLRKKGVADNEDSDR